MRAQVAIAPTLLIAVVYRHRRGTELDQLNQLVNVLQSIQLPFALLPARPHAVGALSVTWPWRQPPGVCGHVCGSPSCCPSIVIGVALAPATRSVWACVRIALTRVEVTRSTALLELSLSTQGTPAFHDTAQVPSMRASSADWCIKVWLDGLLMIRPFETQAVPLRCLL